MNWAPRRSEGIFKADKLMHPVGHPVTGEIGPYGRSPDSPRGLRSILLGIILGEAEELPKTTAWTPADSIR